MLKTVVFHALFIESTCLLVKIGFIGRKTIKMPNTAHQFAKIFAQYSLWSEKWWVRYFGIYAHAFHTHACIVVLS